MPEPLPPDPLPPDPVLMLVVVCSFQVPHPVVKNAISPGLISTVTLPLIAPPLSRTALRSSVIAESRAHAQTVAAVVVVYTPGLMSTPTLKVESYPIESATVAEAGPAAVMRAAAVTAMPLTHKVLRINANPFGGPARISAAGPGMRRRPDVEHVKLKCFGE